MKKIILFLQLLLVTGCVTAPKPPEQGEACINIHKTGGNFHFIQSDDEEEDLLIQPNPAPSPQ